VLKTSLIFDLGGHMQMPQVDNYTPGSDEHIRHRDLQNRLQILPYAAYKNSAKRNLLSER
jgi:hypothetical protein